MGIVNQEVKMPPDQVYTEMQEYVGDWVVTPPKNVLVLMCDRTYNNQEARKQSHGFLLCPPECVRVQYVGPYLEEIGIHKQHREDGGTAMGWWGPFVCFLGFSGGGEEGEECIHSIFEVFLSYPSSLYLLLTSLLHNQWYHRKINAKELWLQATQQNCDVCKSCAVQ